MNKLGFAAASQLWEIFPREKEFISWIMAASYNTDDVNHVTKEVSNSIHDGAAPATIDISTSALLRPKKKEYSIRMVHFSLAFIHLGFAGLQILARVALVDGVSQYMFSIYRNILGFALIAPLAYYVERSAGSIYSSSISCLFSLTLSGFHNIRGATLANLPFAVQLPIENFVSWISLQNTSRLFWSTPMDPVAGTNIYWRSRRQLSLLIRLGIWCTCAAEGRGLNWHSQCSVNSIC